MRCVQCNNPEVTAISAEGGGIAAYYPPKAECPRSPHIAENTQEVKSIGGEVIARVCGLCHQRFSVSTCLGCGRDILRADGARSQFPACSDGCAKKAAQARAKERQATQKKAEKKAARR